jgi:signal transduction histidine kinase
MKLFLKYSRINIISGIFVLLLGSICYYFIIRYVLIRQLDDSIKIEEAEILDNVRTKGRLPQPANYRDQQIRFSPSAKPVKRKYIHTRWYDSVHHENKPFRQLLFPVVVNGQTYTASVGKSEVEAEYLLALIVLITAAIILLLLLSVFVANRWLLRKIWRPFYNTLDSIRQFQLSSRKPFPIAPTDIEEFDNLDAAVGQMTHKILKDYDLLKNFADNASHEMQTPLAIINSKLDLMIQDQELGEKHLRQLQAMYDAVRRLSNLNQSLLLLTKIEGRQFAHTDLVALPPLIREKLVQFEDLIAARSLQVHTDIDDASIRMNSYLADILLNNLLANAIRHNEDGGSLSIRLQQNVLQISNTGPPLHFDPATIFDRFTKGSHSGGTGLGLAIVKQILDTYGFPVAYTYYNNVHIIDIGWPVQNFTRIGM